MRLLHTLSVAASFLFLAATAARADVTISSDATQNMSCSGGVCQPTASDAVLNVGDLETLLAAGSVTVMTAGSGVQANNIDLTAKLGWNANALTLDAYQSISVTAPVTANGASGLSILTDDGGTGGEFAFLGKGHVNIERLSGNLVINGATYELVDSIASISAATQNNPSGYYALASDYNAAKDGTYHYPPIPGTFSGIFEGLGNVITNLTISISPVKKIWAVAGLFEANTGKLSNVRIENIDITVKKVNSRWGEVISGALVGENNGVIQHSCASGSIIISRNASAGGLAGWNGGLLAASCAHVRLKIGEGNDYVGGLVGANFGGGQISASYANGDVVGPNNGGGLVGSNDGGTIENSYAGGAVKGGNYVGGLIGTNGSAVTDSYSTGHVTGSNSIGGLIGEDNSMSGSLSDTYWDTNTSGIVNLGQGAGNIENDPGITGLSTAQLQSGLPDGFDPSIWGENANINNGLPYLIANPPQ